MTEPVIEGAELAAGHDGRAEVVVRIRYGNGAVRSSSLSEEAVADALAAAGVGHLDDLVGKPWTVLLASTGERAGMRARGGS